jgi:hypothetical protein
MKQSVDVFIYSYSNDHLLQSIRSMVTNFDVRYLLNITIFDQSAKYIDKELLNIKEGHVGISYNKVDILSKKSPILYKKDFIDNSSADYIAFMGDSTTYSVSWNKKIINFLLEFPEAIVSGQGKMSYSKVNGFLDKKYSRGPYFLKADFIDRDFIFGRREIFKKISMPSYLVYYGEEEDILLSCIENKIPVYTRPSNTCIIDRNKHDVTGMYSIPIHENKNLPYDVKENYTLLLDKIKSATFDISGSYLSKI